MYIINSCIVLQQPGTQSAAYARAGRHLQSQRRQERDYENRRLRR